MIAPVFGPDVRTRLIKFLAVISRGRSHRSIAATYCSVS
jgi:hypothetical protein